MNRITLFSTTTCSPCGVVRRRLTNEGIPFDEVKLDLPENAETLARLKHTLERDIISTPLIRYAGEHRTIAGLSDIITQYKEATNG